MKKKLLLMCLAFSVCIATQSTETVFAASKWVKNNTHWYYNENGINRTGWILDGGSWYYLDSNGVMATGWTKVQGSWYYLNPNGQMATGWKEVQGSWYYLNPNGQMVTGWKQLQSSWYYLNPNGQMATSWKQIQDTWYYLNPNGEMAKNTTIDGCYLDDTGAWRKDNSSNWNDSNSSWIVEKNGWLYYSNNADKQKLYKMKKDGSSKTKLTNIGAENLQLIGDYIYYSSGWTSYGLRDNYGIYKIKIDGTENTKIITPINNKIILKFTILNDWIYYTSFNAEGNFTGYLYKTKLDGTYHSNVPNAREISNLIAINNSIYYQRSIGMSGNKEIHKLSSDDKNNITIIDKSQISFLGIKDDWIYYSDFSNNGLFKVKTDGSNKTKLVDSISVQRANIIDDYIYYCEYKCDSEATFYKIKLDGTNKSKLGNQRIESINVIGNYIYYLANPHDDRYDLYRMKNDGTEVEKLN